MVGFPEAVDGTDILPVAGETVGDQFLAFRDHVGNDVLAKVMVGV